MEYKEPLPEYKPIRELWEDKGERELALAAVEYFLQNPGWNDRDRVKLRAAYNRYGNGMFIWKYYAAARCYIGGVPALSAHLQLKRSP